MVLFIRYKCNIMYANIEMDGYLLLDVKQIKLHLFMSFYADTQ